MYPRRKGDIDNYGNNGVGPVWCYPMDKIYDNANRPSPEELEKVKDALREELEKLLL